MISERQTVQVKGNMAGDAYKAGIDDENMSHIIGLFTDLYSDRVMAVIREYSTNALDAQIEAGVNRPIEVTLPSALSPFFKVKDYGVGLSHDDIRTVYSRYGTSTKRHTNDQNGMLGLGCKSALTYSDQFTVESVKDGVKVVCSISRDGQSVPVFNVIDTRATDEPNGTTVIVPARRYDETDFQRKATRFYALWKPGTVLVNGQPPKRVEGLELTDTIRVVTEADFAHRNSDHVLMGNVAYPHSFNHGMPYGYRVIVEVPTGSVEFAPSREALSYSRRTNEVLKDVGDKIAPAVDAAVQREVEQATTPQGAIRTIVRWRAIMGRGAKGFSTFRFKGRTLIDMLPGVWTVSSRNSSRLSGASVAPQGLALDYVPDALFVTGYTPANFTANHKRKLLQFCEEQNIAPETSRTFVLTAQTAVTSEYVRAEQVVAWADVNAVKLPRAARTSNGRPSGSYDCYVDGAYAPLQADEIEALDRPIFYSAGHNRYEVRNWMQATLDLYPDAVFVRLPQNRVAKFCRYFTDAKPWREGIKVKYQGWAAGLSEGQRIAIQMADANRRGLLLKLDPKRIDDPELRAACWIARNLDPAALLKQRSVFSRYLSIENAKVTEAWTDPTSKYALIDILDNAGVGIVRAARTDDLYLYLNVAYAARKEA